MTKPLAMVGEWVSCPNGHRIAQVARPVMPSEVLSPSLFENWQISPGKPGDEIAPCSICGEAFVRRLGGIVALHEVHIEGRGWV